MKNKSLRWVLSVGAIGSAVAPLLLAPTLPACLSSASSADGGSSSGSGGSSGSSSGPSDGSSSGNNQCIGPFDGTNSPASTNCIIDDMSNIYNAYMGYWYSFSDRTVPFGTDMVPNAQGTVNPVEGAQYPPSDPNAMTGGPGPMIGGMALPFRDFSGGGLTLWGAGMGFDFVDQIQGDSGTLPDGAYVLGTPVAYDGSAHNGIAFYGKSNTGATQGVGIHLADHREAAGGNVCDANLPYTTFNDAGGGADIVKNALECGADFLKNENFSTSWQYFHVTWKQFGKSQNYPTGTSMYPQVDPTTLFYLHFQVNNTPYAGTGPTPMPEPSWDISVAYVTWYDGM